MSGVVRWLRAFGRFWVDFVVGDDWTVAVLVVVAIGITAVVAHAGLAAWPLLPLAVTAGLSWTVLRAVRPRPPS